jgi:hypothetical protein
MKLSAKLKNICESDLKLKENLGQELKSYDRKIESIAKSVEALASEIYEEDVKNGDVMTISKAITEKILEKIKNNEIA